MWILDTDHLSLWQSGEGAKALRLRAKLEDIPQDQRVTTIVTFEEQTQGWFKYIKDARTSLDKVVAAYGKLAKHLDDYRSLIVLEFDDRAARQYQIIDSLKLRVATLDQRIAAIVLANDGTLLTANDKHFRKVPGLKFEDWTV